MLAGTPEAGGAVWGYLSGQPPQGSRAVPLSSVALSPWARVARQEVVCRHRACWGAPRVQGAGLPGCSGCGRAVCAGRGRLRTHLAAARVAVRGPERDFYTAVLSRSHPLAVFIKKGLGNVINCETAYPRAARR